LGNGQRGSGFDAATRAYKEGKAVAVMIPFRMLLLSLFLVAGVRAQEPASTPSTAPSSDSSASSSSTDSSDAAAKAAARKKHFEEMKKALEEKDPQPPPAPAAATAAATPRAQAPTAPYYAKDAPVSNLAVTMFVGETQPLKLYDNERHDLTHQAEWWSSDSSVADLSTSGDSAFVAGKKAGTALVLAHTKMQTTRVFLTVREKSEMKGTAERWNQNLIAVHAGIFIVPAMPRMGGR
jgi:cytoskeletal protein RodZ